MLQKGEIAANGMIEGAYIALLDYPALLDNRHAIEEKGERCTLEIYPDIEENLQAAHFAGFTAGYRWIIEIVEEDKEAIENLASVIASSTRLGALKLIKLHFEHFYSESSLAEELEEVLNEFEEGINNDTDK